VATRPPAVDEWVDDEADWKDDPPSNGFGLSKAEGISELPSYQKPLHYYGIELPSAEQFVEAIPAAAATGAGLLATKNPVLAGAAGSVAGESARQLLRRLMGAPAATGVAQQAFKLDPNSTEAAAAGLAGEGAAGAIGGISQRLLNYLSKASGRSANRWIVDLLRPRGERETADAVRLAAMARSEGIVPAFSGAAEQASRAAGVLAPASAEAKRLMSEGVKRGTTVEAAPVFQSALDEIPARLPGGGLPATGQPERRAARLVAEDALNTIAAVGQGPAGTQVPLEAAVSERTRLDSLLKAMYDRGGTEAPVAKQAIQSSADAWRKAIADSYPELGAANKRMSDLITIQDMLQRAAKQAERGGAAGAGSEAGAVGAAAAGRLSIPAMVAAKMGLMSAPGASAMSAAMSAFSKMTAAGMPASQAVAHITDLLGAGIERPDAVARRRRAAAEALRAQGEGVTTP
jgi:hypothetical protein